MINLNAYVFRVLRLCRWTVPALIFICSLSLANCSTLEGEMVTPDRSRQSLAFGEVLINITGPNPRQFPAQLRFFDVVNISSQERTRVSVKKEAGAFSILLEPGQYEIVRMQINEGPFMAESHVSWSFDVKASVVTYLGQWELDVDTPRTQRMVRVKVSQDRSSWDAIVESEPEFASQTVTNSLPEIGNDVTRLYAVAPSPKIKYFYRR